MRENQKKFYRENQLKKSEINSSFHLREMLEMLFTQNLEVSEKIGKEVIQ